MNLKSIVSYISLDFVQIVVNYKKYKKNTTIIGENYLTIYIFCNNFEMLF